MRKRCTICGLEAEQRHPQVNDGWNLERLVWRHVGTPSEPHEPQLAPSEPAQRA